MSPPDLPERRDAMRASDADRERIVELLRTAMAEGRLTQAELMQRSDTAYSARTYADLDALVADLPPLAGNPARRLPAAPAGRSVATGPDALPARRDSGDQSLRAAWLVWASAVSINLVIWALVTLNVGELVYFWPMWVAGPWGAVLLVPTVMRGLGGRR